jgi:hypothetical protein
MIGKTFHHLHPQRIQTFFCFIQSKMKSRLYIDLSIRIFPMGSEVCICSYLSVDTHLAKSMHDH